MGYIIPVGVLVLLFQNSIVVNAMCAINCPDSWVGDNWCDSACNNSACNWDDGDCDDDYAASCNFFCDSSHVGDGTCDYWCSGSDCNYDNGDCVRECDRTDECTLDKVAMGECGFFSQKSDKWCNFGGETVCCSDSADHSDCCESNPVTISSIVVGVFLFLAIPSIWAWKKKRRDNTNDTPPQICYKLWCPVCSIIGHQGCESKMDICMSYWCCCFFTACCWSPKAVVVVENTEIAPDEIQMVKV